MSRPMKRSAMRVRMTRESEKAKARAFRDMLAGLAMGAAGILTVAAWIAAEIARAS